MKDILNETTYPTREVERIVKWVMRYLDVDRKAAFVKVKHHDGPHAYQGRFYAHAWTHRGSFFDRRSGEYRDVGPKVPVGFNHLIVARIGKPGTYPVTNHVYNRKDSPVCR